MDVLDIYERRAQGNASRNALDEFSIRDFFFVFLGSLLAMC